MHCFPEVCLIHETSANFVLGLDFHEVLKQTFQDAISTFKLKKDIVTYGAKLVQ